MKKLKAQSNPAKAGSSATKIGGQVGCASTIKIILAADKRRLYADKKIKNSVSSVSLW